MHAPLDRDRLRTALADDVVLEVHESLGSTTDRAAVLTAGGAAGGDVGVRAVVLAEQQTAGRGRRGRAWSSPHRTSVSLSAAVRTAVPPSRRPLVALLVGLAVRDAVVTALAADRVGLKWPNDVLVDDAKVAGILVDGAADHLVVGVGVNVSAVPEGVPGATSLQVAAEAPVDRTDVVVALLSALADRLGAWEAAAGRVSLQDYRAVCRTVGRRVRVHLPGDRHLDGTAAAVDDDGRLVLRTADGEVHRLPAGDVVHVRPG